ncbi:MAG: hypothetical protein JXR65_01415 [Bacteroidales bacterium]|nr:hypothetical protein [Bacteroidales bacterium]
MLKVRNRNAGYQLVQFKLSKKQMKSLKNYCRARKTSPNKLIKKSIRYYTEHFSDGVPQKFYATANQLDIFHDIEKDETPLSLF